MNRLWAVISALALVLAGCSDESSASIAKKPLPPLGGTEVLRNVYDDQQATAYIKVDSPSCAGEDDALADIMAKKKEWERQFPAKKVVAISVVTGSSQYYHSHPAVVGLLIHYEKR